MKWWIFLVLVASVIASCDSTTKRLTDYSVHGIDVSHYQSVIEWDTVADQGFHFAFIKATEGETHRDSLFCRNWDELGRVGLKRGAYHFFRPTISALNQAENFADLVELEAGDLPPVLDVEVIDGVSKVELINGIRTWLYSVEIKYDIKPIIYTNYKFYHQYLLGHFDDYPLWLAKYNHRRPRLAGGKEWNFWQYGNKGQIKGVEGYVDYNVFNGELEDLEAFCLEEPPARILSGL